MNWLKVNTFLICVVSAMSLQCTPFNDVLDRTFKCKGYFLMNYTCNFQFHHSDLEVYVEYDNAKHNLNCTNKDQYFTCHMNSYDYEDLLVPDHIENFNFRVYEPSKGRTFCQKVAHLETVVLPEYNFTEISKTDRNIEFQLYYNEHSQYLNSINFIPYNVSYKCKYDLCHRRNIFTNRLRFNLTNLPYAFYSYEIEIKISIENSSFWREQVLNIQTDSRKPEKSPVFENYYFSVAEPQRQITLYWDMLDSKFYNGPNFHYKLLVEKNGLFFKNIYESGNQIHLDLSPLENYTFSLQSCNKIGCSSNKTTIFYHQRNINYKLFVWTTFKPNNYRLFWYISNENEETPLNLMVAFYDQNSMKINFIKGINTTTNSFEITSSKDPTFGVIANYKNYTTGIVWNFCKSEAKSGLNAPEVILLRNYSSEIRVLFQNFYCIHKASADFYEINYCSEENCSQRNITNKDLIGDEFTLQNLEAFTNYNVSVRIYNKYIGYGRPSKPIQCRTGEDVSSAPENLQITNRTSSSLSLSWIIPKYIHGEAQFYKLYFSNTSIKIPVNETNVIVKFLKCNTTYPFYVTLQTKFFESAPSNIIEGTTLIGAPSKPELNDITYKGSQVILEWKESECFKSSHSFYVLSIGERQSILPTGKCTLTQPICENNVSALVRLNAVNKVPKSDHYSGNCIVSETFDDLCLENYGNLFSEQDILICSEDLETELKCNSFDYLNILYIALPVIFIFISIICIIVVRKFMSMRDIKCVPPKGLIEANGACNEEMYNLMNVNR